MSGHHQQTTIYTIQDSQLNNGGGGGGSAGGSGLQRNSNADLLIDTSGVPMGQQQQVMSAMQHAHHPLQPQPVQPQAFDSTITSQPVNGSSSAAGAAAASARVAPESQNVVYSVHPVFGMLDNHDTLLIRQKADCTSTCCGFESDNTYTVRDKEGTPVLKAIENSNCCERCCFEGNREYNLSLVHGEEVVARIRKPYRVSRFCCYSNSVRIESPEDNPIGHIRQMFTLFGHPRYAIYDCQQPPKQASFFIESVSCRFCCTPCLCTCICGNKEFRIISTESKEEVGTITRHWSASSSAADGDQEAAAAIQAENGQEDADNQPNSSSNNNNPDQPFGGGGGGSGGGSDSPTNDQLFGVQFASNLEARHKVLLLSACFMMDFFYFENDRRRRKLASC